MRRPGQYLAAFSLVGGAWALASCAPVATDGQGITQGPACSQTNVSGMFMSQTFPAVDEGGGRVGLLYTGSADVVTPDETYGNYRLYDCRSGRQQGFDAYMMRETRYRGVSVNLEEFVSAARAEGLMSRPAQLLKAADRAGFEPVAAHQRETFNAETAACACALFYPDLPRLSAGAEITQ